MRNLLKQRLQLKKALLPSKKVHTGGAGLCSQLGRYDLNGHKLSKVCA